MLSIKENLNSFFYPEKQIENQIDKIFFYYDVYTTNFSRIQKVATILIFGLSGILILDFIKYINSTLNQASKELAIIHIVFFIFSIFLKLTVSIILKKTQSLSVFRIFQWSIIIIILGINIYTTLIDQKINGQITVLVMAYFGISVLIYIFPIDGLFLYAISTLSFFFLLPFFQSNKEIITSHHINVPILVLLSYFISNLFYKNKVNDFIKSQRIQKTTEEFDNLIQKILPENISFKIRKEGKIEPRINDATIVFVDFVSFSIIMNKTNIQIVLKTLEELFEEFDYIIKKYKLEKIKTIGDSYMFAGGLFSNHSQLKECIDASIEIINFLEIKKKELINHTGYPWEVRIGIDHGKIVSGIIGNWRFVFDVWGDTVNIASRLVTECEPKKINISKNVFDKIWMYNEYEFEPRGVIPIKNLGTIEMFYVHSSKKFLQKESN